MPLAIPSVIGAPFCSAGTLGTDYVLPSAIASGTVVSQPNGVPIIQEQPLTAGGLPVSRKEWNGSVRFYSNFLVWLNAGGQFTFDAAVVAQGGYSVGMILFDYATNRQVISLINNNTNNFVSTPSFIDNTNWAYYPRDLFTRNVPILGNTPSSKIETGKFGAYTFGQIQSTNGVLNNQALVNTFYQDPGNGVFKPYGSISAQDSNTIYGSFSSVPAGVISGYFGYISANISQISATQFARQECYWANALGGMRATLFATNDNLGITTSGIQCDSGTRPVLIRYSAGTVSNTNLGSLTVLNDFPFTVAGNGIQRLPGGFILQWFSVTINTRTNNTISYPITFPTQALRGVGSIDGGLTLNLSQGYGVNVSIINASQCTVSLTTAAAAGAAVPVSIFIVGN
jgi:hypothetical protein